MSQLTTKLTDRRPDDDVMTATDAEQPNAQAEAESGAAVRVERFVRRRHIDNLHFWRVHDIRNSFEPQFGHKLSCLM